MPPTFEGCVSMSAAPPRPPPPGAHLKSRVLRFRIDLDVVLVLRWTASNPRPLPSSTPLVVKKRLEDVRLDFRGNARTVIADPHHNAAFVAKSTDPQPTILAHASIALLMMFIHT